MGINKVDEGYEGQTLQGGRFPKTKRILEEAMAGSREGGGQAGGQRPSLGYQDALEQFQKGQVSTVDLSRDPDTIVIGYTVWEYW